MHTCLQVPELRSQIINHLPDATTTRSLALTCQTLAEPTLDFLWSKWQHELTILLVCLPLMPDTGATVSTLITSKLILLTHKGLPDSIARAFIERVDKVLHQCQSDEDDAVRPCPTRW
jgi:hypothetical protein